MIKKNMFFVVFILYVSFILPINHAASSTTFQVKQLTCEIPLNWIHDKNIETETLNVIKSHESRSEVQVAAYSLVEKNTPIANFICITEKYKNAYTEFKKIINKNGIEQLYSEIKNELRSGIGDENDTLKFGEESFSNDGDMIRIDIPYSVTYGGVLTVSRIQSRVVIEDDIYSLDIGYVEDFLDAKNDVENVLESLQFSYSKGDNYAKYTIALILSFIILIVLHILIKRYIRRRDTKCHAMDASDEATLMANMSQEFQIEDTLKEKSATKPEYVDVPLYNRTWFRFVLLLLASILSERITSLGNVSIQFTPMYYYALVLFDLAMCLFFILGISKSTLGKIAQFTFGYVVLLVRIFLILRFIVL